MKAPRTGSTRGRPDSTGASPRSNQAIFLERHSYRRRRLVDVARLLPLLGVLLLLVPLMWMGVDDPDVVSGAVAPMPMSKAITYIFAVWGALIIGAAVFGIGARRWGEDAPQAGPGPD